MNQMYGNISTKGRSAYVFISILKKWRGSLYKLVKMDFIVYMALFYTINLCYRFALDEDHRKMFIKVVQFAEETKGKIPFFFLLGFFVTGVIARWIQMYLFIPWLNRPAFVFESFINGDLSSKSVRIKKIVMRYINLSWILLMRKISEQIALRFRKNSVHGSENSVQSSSSAELNVRDVFMNFNRDKKIQQTFGKIITDSEIRVFENIAIQFYKSSKKYYEPEYWVPLQWASRILQKSFIHGYVSDPRTVNKMIEEVENMRTALQRLDLFCGIMIPLVYTQVVIIAVYSYFICELFAAQVIDPGHKVNGTDFDLYIPFFSIFNFLFMMGWLKVAFCVMNPFGSDDEDFPTSDILDYNLDVTSRSVCGAKEMFPERLEQPHMQYECRFKVSPEDNLETFLDAIDYDLDDIDKDSDHMEVNALEMKPSLYKKITDRICCKPSNKTKDDEIIMEERPEKRYSIAFPMDERLLTQATEDSTVCDRRSSNVVN